MQSFLSTTQKLFLAGFLVLFVLGASAQQRRAMTLEDIMNFHHIDAQAINYDGSWVAYAASPDRGDGYGMLVAADGRREHRVERGVNPRFSASGQWLLFTQLPPFVEIEGKRPANRPNNGAVLIRTRDRQVTSFENVRQATFSDSGEILLVHHHREKDENLSDEVNEQLGKAGTPLYVENLSNGVATTIDFVDSWTVDSLATTLVFTKKDTLERNNGLYALPLNDLAAPFVVVDTIGSARFSRFTWYNTPARLAYMREENLEKDTMETAGLYVWLPGKNAPNQLISQMDAPDGYFLPYDNSLTWSYDGDRLFFGFRPERFAATAEEAPSYVSELDSIRATAAIDIWHGEDAYIKTQEKVMWNQVRRQNLSAVYHVADGRLVQLADESLSSVRTARSGSSVIATTSDPYVKRITWEGRFNDVYLIDLNTGERQLMLEEFQGQTHLSPDGQYFLYFLDKHWHVYDMSARTTSKLTKNIDIPFYSETHDRPSTVPAYGLAGWLNDMESVLIYDRYDLWRFNLRSGEAINLTEGEGRKQQVSFRIRRLDSQPMLDATGEVLMEGFNDNTKVRAIYTAQLDRQGVSKVLDTGQNLRLRQLTGDETHIMFTRESQDLFPDLWVTDIRFRDQVKVSDLQRQLAPFNWGRASLVSYQSADGVPLQGIVIKPGDYDPSKRYPVFVYFYEQFSQRLHDFNQTVINHRPSFGYYASNGYVVFLPDVHFIEGRPGMSAVKALVPGVQKLIDLGIADPNAIGLHGHSWSGYLAAYVVTQTDIFAATIAGAPVSNMTSAYSGIRWGSGMARQFQYETGQSRIGSSLFDRRYLYIENSPVFYAHEINTPVLLMHGDVDEAVPWEQSIEMYLAMRRAGKEVIFLQYRDEPHHPQKYSNKVDYTIRMKEYFDHYLKGKEAPEWIRTGIPFRGN